MVDSYVVEITEDALNDLAEHMDYLIDTEGNPDKALSLSDQFEASIDKIKENPHRAQKYGEGRRFKIQNTSYSIYMQVRELERKVVVTNIYHDKQNRPL